MKRLKKHRQPETTIDTEFPSVLLLSGQRLRQARDIYQLDFEVARESRFQKLSARSQVHPLVVKWQGWVEHLKGGVYPWATGQVRDNLIQFGQSELKKVIEKVSKEV